MKSNTRAEILDKAKEVVSQDRQSVYGEPEDSFQLISDLWTDFLGVPICASEVAVMMILLKVARIRSEIRGNNFHIDNWIDIAGYSSCGGEIQKGLAKYQERQAVQFGKSENTDCNCGHCTCGKEKKEIVLTDNMDTIEEEYVETESLLDLIAEAERDIIAVTDLSEENVKQIENAAKKLDELEKEMKTRQECQNDQVMEKNVKDIIKALNKKYPGSEYNDEFENIARNVYNWTDKDKDQMLLENKFTDGFKNIVKRAYNKRKAQRTIYDNLVKSIKGRYPSLQSDVVQNTIDRFYIMETERLNKICLDVNNQFDKDVIDSIKVARKVEEN